MNIPPFWAKSRFEGAGARGRVREVESCGWSFTSLQEAEEDAAARAQRVFELLESGREPERYAYGDRPVKEEILKEIHDGDARIAVITRNRYGALVLNCSEALFVDVDFPKVRPAGILEALFSLFRPTKAREKGQAAEEETIGQVEEWAGRNPEHGFRLYRTKEGLRLLFTFKRFEPNSEETARILSELGADPMYVKLTQNQECFRARLTSKPWRCGCPKPPNAFPWPDAKAERKYRQWQESYTKRDAGFKVCELVGEFGTPSGIPSLQTVADIHDRGTRVGSDAPLA